MEYTLSPLIELCNNIFIFIFNMTNERATLSIIILSAVSSIIMTPLNKWASQYSQKEKDIKNVLLPQVSLIKSESQGRERHERISLLYKRYGYNPIYAFRSIIGLLLHLPLLIAVYYMLKLQPSLQGRGAIGGFITDLSQPDKILAGINILPFLMTILSIIAAFFIPSMSKTERKQAIVISLIFGVLLYQAPSALLIYWSFMQLAIIAIALFQIGLYRPAKIIADSDWIAPLSIALLIASTLYFFYPLSVIFRFPLSITDNTNTLIYWYAQQCLYLFVGIGFILFCLCLINYIRRSILAITLAFGVLFWIQSSIVAWSYGNLDGQAINWNSFWWRELIDASLWISILSIAWLYRDFFSRKCMQISLFILFIQAIYFFNNQPDNWVYSKDKYTLDDSKHFTLSKNKNVIIIVLDAYYSNLFDEVLEEHPEFKEDLDGFVRVKDMLGVSWYTNYSIPTLLTGQQYLNEKPFGIYLVEAFESDRSILKKLKNEGWETGAHTMAAPRIPSIQTELRTRDSYNYSNQNADLRGVSLYSALPQTLKRYAFNKLEIDKYWMRVDSIPTESDRQNRVRFGINPLPENNRDLLFANRFLSEVKDDYDAPAFKLYHLLGIHAPRTIDRNLNNKNTNEITNLDAGIASTKIAIRILEILRAKGLYDNSQIYIIADHGYKSPNYHKRAQALFLFKDFNNHGKLTEYNDLQLTFLDGPELIYSMILKDASIEPNIVFKAHTRQIRPFYSFTNTEFSRTPEGAFYGDIKKLLVNGNSHEPKSWTWTEKVYRPRKLQNQYKLKFGSIIDFHDYSTPKYLTGKFFGATSGHARGYQSRLELPIDDSTSSKGFSLHIEAVARLPEYIDSATVTLSFNGINHTPIVLSNNKRREPVNLRIHFPNNLENNKVIIDFTVNNVSYKPEATELQKTHYNSVFFMVHKLKITHTLPNDLPLKQIIIHN